MYNIHSNSTENSVKLIYSYNFYRQISTDPRLNDDGNNNQVKSIPFPIFRKKGPPRSNTSRLSSQLLLWPFSKSFPLFQLSPVSLPSSSFSVFLFYVILGDSNSKLAFFMVEESFLSVRPIHFHFRSLISAATRFSCTRLHSSSFWGNTSSKNLKSFPKALVYKCLRVICYSWCHLPCFVPI